MIKHEPHKKIAEGLTLLIGGYLDDIESSLRELEDLGREEPILKDAIKFSLIKTEDYLKDAKKLSYFPNPDLGLLQGKYNDLNRRFEASKK